MMSTNPYAAPATNVADVPEPAREGNFIATGRSRPAGNGWDWIKSARELTRPRVGLWMGILIVFVVITAGFSAVPVIGPLAMYFIMPVMLGGIMLTCDKAFKGEDITFGDSFAGFRTHFARLAGVGLATLLMYLIIFAAVAVIFGSGAALVLSGVSKPEASDPAFVIGVLIAGLVVMSLSVPVYMALWFSYALVTLNNYSVIQALKTSFSACTKNMWAFLVYGVMMLLLAIAASIPFMLGWLILGPVLFASLYTGYRDIYYEA
ncbi:MAG TPA: BPSS1780 family membrane protein [Burkholderiales bacterium]|nr:BPSS1780 family membrane protein [Burkholderiales bacterium]